MDADSDIGFASTQSDEDESSTENEYYKKKTRKRLKKGRKDLLQARDQKQNIILKLRNRERFGCFSNSPSIKCRQQPFRKIPPALSFCLKNVIPCCYLEGHIFMGLTVCGQFLISYRVRVDDEVLTSYDVSAVYRYELYFWIYRPHYPLHKYFCICLFDDHGVDGVKKVSMTQWTSSSSVLVVHGESDTNENDSYITYIRVPKLGCLDCKELRKDYYDGWTAREAILCIKCALTIHVKYRLDPASKFTPKINLNCPDYILITESSMIHTVNVKLEVQKVKESYNPCNYRYTPVMMSQKPLDFDAKSDTQSTFSESDAPITRKLTIVDEIIVDFEELETESLTGKTTPKPESILDFDSNSLNKYLIKTPNQRTGLEVYPCTSSNLMGSELCSPLKDITTNKISSKEKIKLYEFSEDIEKCEKISTFRKRRLADKKYEFIEDSFDNILPFNRIRDRIRNRMPKNHITQASNVEIGSHLHRVSPVQGFRSPCGSPVGYRYLRSPPGLRSPNYYQQRSPSHSMYTNHNSVKHFSSAGMISPRQHNKRSENSLQLYPLLSPNNREDLRKSISSPIHKPYDMENNENHSSLSNLVESKTDKDIRTEDTQEPWKILCSKKFTRRFVEEDDANSVITTTEEDDCISPGYHTALPLEVHGACYSHLQSISKTSCSQLKNRPVVYVTQNTFDIESFTVNVATFVCKQNGKTYDMLSDSTYSIVYVCPISSSVTCAMRIEFFANDIDEDNAGLRKPATRHKYLLRILFTWIIQNGSLKIIDYGKMIQLKSCKQTLAMNDIPQLTKKLEENQSNIFTHIRVLTADMAKSKQKLVDMQNMIEFYRKNKEDDSDFSISDSFPNTDTSSDSDLSSEM